MLTAWLVSYGWTQNLADPGCFTITVDGHLYILAVYVDDCILLGKQGPFIDRFKVVRDHGSSFCGMMYLDVFASRSCTLDECDCL